MSGEQQDTKGGLRNSSLYKTENFPETRLQRINGITQGLGSTAFDSLDRDFNLLDGHLTGVTIELRSIPLARPPFIEVVASDFGRTIIVKDND